MNDDETYLDALNRAFNDTKLDALREYVQNPGWNDRYSRIPSEKQIVLDELFGVK
jgi:hypothetical protein